MWVDPKRHWGALVIGDCSVARRLGLPVSLSTGLPRLCPSPRPPIGADPQL